MKYRVVITRFEDNPDYAAELKAYEDRIRQFGNPVPAPEREHASKVLETVLTESEFRAARDAILSKL